MEHSQLRQTIFCKRLWIGFSLAELGAWLCLHISWPLLLAAIYNLTGRFKDSSFMSLQDFFIIQLVVCTGKAIFLLPLWWLFFGPFKHIKLGRKLLLHSLGALFYSVCCLVVFHWVISGWMHKDYNWAKLLNDLYNLLFFYFANFALFHAYNFWLQSMRQSKTEQELRELALQSEILALKAQIEPHFLFNTLNSISASVPSSQEETRVLIAQLADTFRYALQVSEKETVQLREELEFVKTWLSLEKHRFGNRLMIDYKLDESALSARIPSLIFQPLIENAIKHGIGPKVEGGNVTITIRKAGDFVKISIADTGQGFAGDLSRLFTMGVGLKNASRRLEYMYNQKISVERNPVGLLFFFKIPIA